MLIEERKTADGGVIGIRVDISELKAQEARLEEALAQAQAANRAKGEFLANMSHEIRTPLNGVLGLAEVLARTELDDNQRRLLKTIMSSASDLNVLLGDILDFSRLEAGKVDKPQPRGGRGPGLQVRRPVPRQCGGQGPDAGRRRRCGRLRDGDGRRHADQADPDQPAQQRGEVHQPGRGRP